MLRDGSIDATRFNRKHDACVARIKDLTKLLLMLVKRRALSKYLAKPSSVGDLGVSSGLQEM